MSNIKHYSIAKFKNIDGKAILEKRWTLCSEKKRHWIKNSTPKSALKFLGITCKLCLRKK